MSKTPPLIAHVIYNLSIGGLENGLVNLINNIPQHEFRHAIICINTYDPEFAKRIQRKDIEIIAINKKPGRDIAALWRLFQVFRRLKPSIVHSRNLAALDALLPSLLAGVKTRIHSEHGRDDNDTDGNNKKLQLLRKLHRPLVNRYIALSKDLGKYLHQKIGIPKQKIIQIYNGVDTRNFTQSNTKLSQPLPFSTDKIVFGTVGRLQAVKNQTLLINAYHLLLEQYPDFIDNTQLLIVGNGPDIKDIQHLIKEKQLDDNIYLAGARNDIPALLNSMDIFVLPSLSEGISNTILEAMATGLPVIATAVGGNIELVEDQKTGQLVTSDNVQALSDAMKYYLDHPDQIQQHGSAAQARVDQHFTITAMVNNYIKAYKHIR